MWDEVADADVVIHAGDWVEPSLLDALEARAERLVACWGNNDGAELRRRLPERADATLGGLRFTVVHETGAASGREARMAKEYPDTDVLVFGHSHIPWDTTAKTGLRLLNPGSPTDRRRQPYCTYMTATVERRRAVRRRAAQPGPPCVTGRPGSPTCTRSPRRCRTSRASKAPRATPIYQVGGKSFVFFRTPQPDAEDPETGERYADVIMIWVESESDKLALIQDPRLAVLHHRPLRRASVGAGARQAAYARSARPS